MLVAASWRVTIDWWDWSGLVSGRAEALDQRFHPRHLRGDPFRHPVQAG